MGGKAEFEKRQLEIESETAEEVYFVPKSKSISVHEVRQLREIGKVVDLHLTKEEYMIIIGAYHKAMQRLVDESEGLV